MKLNGCKLIIFSYLSFNKILPTISKLSKKDRELSTLIKHFSESRKKDLLSIVYNQELTNIERIAFYFKISDEIELKFSKINNQVNITQLFQFLFELEDTQRMKNIKSIKISHCSLLKLEEYQNNLLPRKRNQFENKIKKFQTLGLSFNGQLSIFDTNICNDKILNFFKGSNSCKIVDSLIHESITHCQIPNTFKNIKKFELDLLDSKQNLELMWHLVYYFCKENQKNKNEKIDFKIHVISDLIIGYYNSIFKYNNMMIISNNYEKLQHCSIKLKIDQKLNFQIGDIISLVEIKFVNYIVEVNLLQLDYYLLIDSQVDWISQNPQLIQKYIPADIDLFLNLLNGKIKSFNDRFNTIKIQKYQSENNNKFKYQLQVTEPNSDRMFIIRANEIKIALA